MEAILLSVLIPVGYLIMTGITGQMIKHHIRWDDNDHPFSEHGRSTVATAWALFWPAVFPVFVAYLLVNLPTLAEYRTMQKEARAEDLRRAENDLRHATKQMQEARTAASSLTAL